MGMTEKAFNKSEECIALHAYLALFYPFAPTLICGWFILDPFACPIFMFSFILEGKPRTIGRGAKERVGGRGGGGAEGEAIRRGGGVGGPEFFQNFLGF